VFDHVTIRVSDRPASERFYETVLRTLGIDKTHSGEQLAEWDDFSIAPADEEKAVTRRLHIGFGAPSREHVDEFWRTGTDAGYRDDGAPGPRPQTTTTAASCSTPTATAPRRFITARCEPEATSTTCGSASRTWPPRRGSTRPSRRTPASAWVPTRRTARSSWARPLPSRWSGRPTEHVHLAFGAGDDATVDAFHRALVEAGYPDDGARGERPVHHPGHYGAYVLDPDGNNVEVVNHHRPGDGA
jgi:catechol 2,3-dioxygenase-like lactoylglutathione lyase family enzyme